jgi:hypothetical protein
MLTPTEEEQLRWILQILSYHPDYNRMYYRPRIDVSHRLRDERGRFLPNNPDICTFGKQEELLLDLSDLDEDEPPREIKLVKVEGTYGTYRIEEKMKVSDVVYLVCFVLILIIAYLA